MSRARSPGLARYSVFAAMLASAGLPIYIHAPKFYVDSYGVGLGVLGGVLGLLLGEPVVNAAIRLFLYKYVGRDAQLHIDWVKGMVRLRNIDLPATLLPGVGVLKLTRVSLFLLCGRQRWRQVL